MKYSHFRFHPFFVCLLALGFTFLMCGQGKQHHQGKEKTAKKEVSPMAFQIKSSAFEPGGPIPRKYTCEGPDVSPPLEWQHVPEGTKSLVLICDDPDAPMGTWVHWVIYNIPADKTSLPEAVKTDRIVLGDIRQGTNDFRRTGYGGPCPPAGKPHRYFFKLYALDVESSWEPGLTKAQVLKKMEGHVLGQAELMGTYQR